MARSSSATGVSMRRTRREFVVGSMAAVAGGMVGAGALSAAPPGAPGTTPGKSPAGAAADSAALLVKNPDHPQPALFDRLDEAWHKRAITRLQGRLREEGLDGVLLGDRWNIIYFTGLFHTTTERPFSILIPSEGMNLTWFHPSLDRDLVGTWWIQDKEHYFDLRHSAGGFPDEGKVVEGDAVDLLRWT